jgi:hypothetical protein
MNLCRLADRQGNSCNYCRRRSDEFWFIAGEQVRREEEPTMNRFSTRTGWQTVAGGRSDSGDLRGRRENAGTPKAVPERNSWIQCMLKKESGFP